MDYKDIVLQIKSDMDNLRIERSNPWIYRIPNALRGTNEKAYTPVKVAIGPYHADNVELKPMEEHKLRYLKAFVSRSTSRCTDETTKLNEYFEAVARLQLDARGCYDGIINLSHHEFTKMLLIDGAFIIELFYKTIDSFMYKHRVDPIFGAKARFDEVLRDLILLENQIPYFILECLFELAPKMQRNNNSGVLTLGMLVYLCLGDSIPISSTRYHLDLEEVLEEVQRRIGIIDDQVLHLVHLMRLFCLPYSLQEPPTISHALTATELQIIPRRPFQPLSATELHEGGIHFKQQAALWPSLHIKFAKGIVEMPRIKVDHNTEVFFRNVMAFEQYHLHQYHVTNYMTMLDGLIDTTKDVEILEKSRVIILKIESMDNVTTLFNSITHQTTFNPWQYSELCKKLNEHAERPWNKWKATLRRDYFGSPWTIISLVAALILLILTVVQTIATVRSTKW